MNRDANAVDSRETIRPSIGSADSLPKYFISDEIVYVVEGIDGNALYPHSLAAERYARGDEWFKVVLHIDCDGDSRKYVATVMRSPEFSNKPRHLRVANLVYEKMKARVLEEVVESAQAPQGMSLGSIPSLVRLEVFDESPLMTEWFHPFTPSNEGLGSSRFLFLDGELRVEGKRLSLVFDKSGREMIEHTSQMMDSLIDQNFQPVLGGRGLNAVDVVLSYVIWIAEPFHWAGRSESL